MLKFQNVILQLCTMNWKEGANKDREPFNQLEVYFNNFWQYCGSRDHDLYSPHDHKCKMSFHDFLGN